MFLKMKKPGTEMRDYTTYLDMFNDGRFTFPEAWTEDFFKKLIASKQIMDKLEDTSKEEVDDEVNLIETHPANMVCPHCAQVFRGANKEEAIKKVREHKATCSWKNKYNKKVDYVKFRDNPMEIL